MKICLVSQEYPPETAWGGIGTQTWVKARGLARQGHEVHVLSRAADDLASLSTDDGVTVHRLRPPGYDFHIYGKAMYMLGYAWHVAGELQTLIENHKPDVIDFADFGAEGFAYQIDRGGWNWTPVVVQLHGPLIMFVEILGWPERGSPMADVGLFMEKYSLRNADAVMAGSRAVADLATQYYGIPPEAIEIVHCGVDTKVFFPDASVPLADKPTVLFVGNLVKNKGVVVLVKAVISLLGKYPDIQLNLFGTGGGTVEEIQRLTRESAAQANIHVRGFLALEELPHQYRTAHVFCLPTYFEAFGQVLLEAMACGCPVITSTAGGSKEAILPGETGLLIAPGDVTGIAAAIDRILGDRALRSRMSETAARHAAENFSMEKFIGRVVKVYEKAIAASDQIPIESRDNKDSSMSIYANRWPEKGS